MVITPRDIGYQGDLKISKANVKVQRVAQIPKKTEENKHGAVIAGSGAKSETVNWD